MADELLLDQHTKAQERIGECQSGSVDGRQQKRIAGENTDKREVEPNVNAHGLEDFEDPLPDYRPGGRDSEGPRACTSRMFRKFDSYCPEHYRCQGYDLDAEWFDGESITELRYAIDLENGTMDRLPDVRPYLYYIGYWGHWELEGASELSILGSMTRADVEEYYVRLGRYYLRKERQLGHGYFWADRNWKALKLAGKISSMPFIDAKGAPTSAENVGLEDYHEVGSGYDFVIGSVLKTNIRTPMPPKQMVIVRPGESDWDPFIQWLYERDNHGIDQVINQLWGQDEIERMRSTENFHGEGRFLVAEAWARYLRRWQD